MDLVKNDREENLVSKKLASVIKEVKVTLNISPFKDYIYKKYQKMRGLEVPGMDNFVNYISGMKVLEPWDIMQ